jgi:hypothetical protein
VGSSPLVSGFFFDDFWPGASGSFPDASAGRIVQDTGMTTADLVSITAAYDANMAALNEQVLARGKFTWQLLWTGGAPNAKGSTGPVPLVKPASCANDLRALCSAGSPQHTNRTMMYAFSNRDPTLANSTLFEADLANFLLTRGDYAYRALVRAGGQGGRNPLRPVSPHSPPSPLPFPSPSAPPLPSLPLCPPPLCPPLPSLPFCCGAVGHGWIGCSRDYRFPDELNVDYGTPTDKLCTEASPGVFTREWTKASVQMDCATFKGTITLK